jgi:hypothetical protein
VNHTTRAAATACVPETTIKQKLLRLGIAGLVAIGLAAGATAAQAAGTGITAVVVQKTGVAFGGCSIGSIGTFTYYQGYATDTIDPKNALNTGITDIGLAPTDSNGYVDVFFNFQIVVPTNLANFAGRLVADWPNRSGSQIANYLNGSATATSAVNCSGTTFYPEGYATSDSGWEQDGAGDPTNNCSTNSFNGSYGVVGVIAPSTPTNCVAGTFTSNVPKMPVATSSGSTITGPGYEYIVSGAGFFNLGGGIAYPNYPAATANANSLGGPCVAPGTGVQASSVMTWRHHLDDTPFVLPTSYWQFNYNNVYTIGNGVDGNCDSVSLTPAAVTAGYGTSCTVSATCPTGADFGGATASGTVAPGANDIYELTYNAAAPTVNGIGHAVNRDWYSWLKGNSGSASQTLNPFASNGTSTLKQIYMTSVSQPDRTFNDYTQLGFNGDLNGKRVVDGAVNWVGASAGISMNYRWSHTTETQRNRQQHLWVENFFPFADVTSTDPISGTTDGRFRICTANNTCPMNYEAWSGNEFWVKAASLGITDPTGSFDLPANPMSRFYYMAGTQHGGGTLTAGGSALASPGSCQNYTDPLDFYYTGRALFVALDQYTVGNIPPPPSANPTLASGTLVSPLKLNFPNGYMHTVNGVNGGNPFPVLYTGLETTQYRFNFGPNFYAKTMNGQGAPGMPYMIPTYNPPYNTMFNQPFENNPANGPIYPTYVPNVNSDGNETSGILMPELRVPIGTYAGWNYRSGGNNAETPNNDGPDGCEASGLFIPFQQTLAARNAASDPRPSIAERYPTYAGYLNQATQAIDTLIWNRFLLCGSDTSPTNTTNSGGGLSSSEFANMVANWTVTAGQSTGGLSPPSFLPACNDAMTHNLNGGNGGIASVGGASGGNASSVLWRDNLGNVGAWLMNGATIANNFVYGNVSPNWTIVGQRDINGDGNADIIWRDNQGNVGVWLMNGTKILSNAVIGNEPTNWSIIGTIGFNTGGYNAILWRDNLGNIIVWFMNGTTITSTATIGNEPLNWVVAGTDVHGDIFWRNLSTGEVGMWQMYGTQIVKTVDWGVVSLNWTIAGIGDFAGNGNYDILWRDNLGNVGMWLLNGTQILSTPGLGNVSLNWTIAQTGDFNADGTSDILWTDKFGNVGVWFMNGTTIQSNLVYGNVGPNWTVQALNSD